MEPLGSWNMMTSVTPTHLSEASGLLQVVQGV